MNTTVSTVIISGMIAVAVLAGCFSLIGAFVPSGNQQQDFGIYNTTYNQFSEMYQNTQNVADQMNPTVVQPDSGLLGIANGLLNTAYSAIGQTWKSIKILYSLLNNLTVSYFNIPGWFVGLLISIITLSVAFSLIGTYFHWWT